MVVEKEVGDLVGLVDHFLLEMDEVKKQQKIKIEVTALTLTPNRFDLAIKLAYLDQPESSFARDLYCEHIKAFSLGRYTERGNSEKKDINDFEKSFKSVFQDIKEKGFDPEKSLIPLACDGSILNGAHRTAVTIFLKKTAATVITDIQPSNYNYDFFVQRGMSQELTDFVARKYIDYSDNCYVALIWPSAKGKKKEIEKAIGKNKIVYKKNIKLNYNAAHNLLVESYLGEPWLGDEEKNYPGVKNKLIPCFPNNDYNVRLYVFQSDSLSDVLNIKEEIRSLFNLGKHALHITDTKLEAKHLASILFNSNSLHFLCHGKPLQFKSTLEKFSAFKQFLSNHHKSFEDFALDTGIVLSMYGVRETSDIDYICLDESFSGSTDIIERHDLSAFGESEQEIIYDPRLHFYYRGIKCVSLKIIGKVKRNRADAKLYADYRKDETDFKMILQLLKGETSKFQEVKCNALYVKARIIIRLRTTFIKALNKLGLYNSFRNRYLKINIRK